MVKSYKLAAIFLVFAAGCQSVTDKKDGGLGTDTGPIGPTNCVMPPSADAGVVDSIVAGNNQFAVDLLNQLGPGSNGGNVFFSPLSLSTALAMTYAGAAGDTATQMAQTLHFTAGQTDLPNGVGALACQLTADGVAPDGGQVDLANEVFGQKGASFEAPFLATLQESYGAPLQQVDFESDPEGARSTINQWVSHETRGKIPDFLAQGTVTPDMKLVLADAVYFEELWSTPFELDSTMNAPFQTMSTGEVMVPMMNGVVSAGYYENPDFTLLELPFSNGHAAMDLFLPANGLGQFEASLSGDNLQAWLGMLATEMVSVSLPKFSLDEKVDLIPTFENLGMTLPFGASADFSGIDGARDLFIGLLQHEAVLDVDELGATAAAATAVGIAGSAAPVPDATFNANQPFVLVIRDTATGTVLFIGQVTDPTAG